jgi:hypothetical protein
VETQRSKNRSSFANLQVGKAGLPPLEQTDDSQEQKTIFHITFFICHFSSAFLHCQSLYAETTYKNGK